MTPQSDPDLLRSMLAKRATEARDPDLLAALRIADRALAEVRLTTLRSCEGYHDTYEVAAMLGRVLRNAGR